MRIISGTFKGHVIEAPKTKKTHPMSDKIRGAMFSVLGDIEGLDFLDAYAGSGAIGFEALSRGAAFVQAIDNDPVASRVIRNTSHSFDVGARYKISAVGFATWSQHNKDSVFDIVSADPPYDNVQPENLSLLSAHVKQGGILVLSWPGRAEVPSIDGCILVRHKKYGDAQLVFYRKDDVE